MSLGSLLKAASIDYKICNLRVLIIFLILLTLTKIICCTYMWDPYCGYNCSLLGCLELSSFHYFPSVLALCKVL